MWQRYKQATKSVLLCIFICWNIIACQNIEPKFQATETIALTVETISSVPHKTISPSPSPSPPTPTLNPTNSAMDPPIDDSQPVHTPRPTSMPMPALTPTMTSTHTTTLKGPFPNHTWTFEPQQFQSAEHDLLHDVILFTSLQENPFNSSSGFVTSNSGYLYYTTTKLFALSPNGELVGRVSPDDRPVTIFLPTNDEETTAIVAYDFHINHPDIETISLPSECYDENQIENRESDVGMFACRHFMFFLNRRYFAYHIGAKSWQTVIDRQMNILIKRGDATIRNEFPTGKALFFALGLDGGDIGVIDLHTLSPIRDDWNIEWLGYAGHTTWNEKRTAIVTSASTLEKSYRWVWGYNAELDFVFLPQSESDKQFNSTPIWAPDGTHVLYRHRPFEFERVDGKLQYTFDQSSEIIKINVETGEKSTLVSDPSIDYRICNGVRNCEPNWYGDWLPIYHLDFVAMTETVAYEDDPPLAGGCLVNDYCDGDVQIEALNWQTGEITTLEAAGINIETIVVEAIPTPTPTPQPVFLQPALYSHPDGTFELYVGQDGHTLWYVPHEEPPVLWVQDGENFVYLP